MRITEMRLAVDRGVGQGKSPGLGGSKGLFGMELVRSRAEWCRPRDGWKRGRGGWAGSLNSGDRELVGRDRVAVEDEDAFVIEREFRGLPGEVGGIERFGLLCVCPAEEGGHADRLHRFDVVGRIGGRRDVEDALPETVCWCFGGMCPMAAARKPVAVKTSKLRLVLQLRLER